MVEVQVEFQYNIIRRCTWVVFLVFIGSCAPNSASQAEKLRWTTQSAPEWSNLFKRTKGWFGGDGIFIIPTTTDRQEDRTKQIILFSDTMVGEVQGGKVKKGFHMLHNSVALLRGTAPNPNSISFPMVSDSSGKEISIFPVKLPLTEPHEYYWLGDGVVSPSTGKTYIFAYRVVDRLEWVNELFKFEVLGGALIVLPPGSEFPYADQYQLKLPFFQGVDDGHISFGAGIFESTEAHAAPDPDGYLYIYGIRDPGKQLVVARVKPNEIENFERWRFYDGNQWQEDFENCATITDSVSNELSVSALVNGQFALVFQINGVSSKVGMRLGPTPIGPFGSIHEIWDCSEALDEPEFFAYNAKAHPTISDHGELLVSYNVNSFAFWDQIEDLPHLYRPRFFKIIFAQ